MRKTVRTVIIKDGDGWPKYSIILGDDWTAKMEVVTIGENVKKHTEAIEVEDVQGYDGADEMFKLRRDTQRVTGSLERDVALLQENQRNVARALIPLERNVADFEKELEAIRAWLGRESDCLRDISTQVHRAIDRMVLVEGDGKLIIRLEDARK